MLIVYTFLRYCFLKSLSIIFITIDGGGGGGDDDVADF